MNFDYDSEQNDLREAVRGLLARAYADSEQRRAVVKAEPGFDEKTWSRPGSRPSRTSCSPSS